MKLLQNKDTLEVILSILPPYPYHFTLRLVSKEFKNIIDNFINPNQFCYSHIFSTTSEELEVYVSLYRDKIGTKNVKLVSLPASLATDVETMERVIKTFPNAEKLIIPFYWNPIEDLFGESSASYPDSKITHLSLLGTPSFDVKNFKVPRLRSKLPKLKSLEVTYHQPLSSTQTFHPYKKIKSLKMADAIYLTEMGINVNMPLKRSYERDEEETTLLDLACGKWEIGDKEVVKYLLNHCGADVDCSIRASTWSKLISRMKDNLESNQLENDVLLFLCEFKKGKEMWDIETFSSILYECQYLVGDHYYPKNYAESHYTDLIDVLDFLFNNELIQLNLEALIIPILHSVSLYEFFKKRKVNFINEHCSVYLFEALMNKFTHCVEDFMQTDYDVNLLFENSQTLLHASIKSNYWRETEILLSKNPKNLNIQNHKNQSILHLLCQGKWNEEKSKIFNTIKDRIDIHLKDHSNQKPFECIQKRYIKDYPSWIFSKKRENQDNSSDQKKKK
jgi:hypothetical protein